MRFQYPLDGGSPKCDEAASCWQAAAGWVCVRSQAGTGGAQGLEDGAG